MAATKVKLNFEPSDMLSWGDYAQCSLGVFNISPTPDGEFALIDHNGKVRGPFHSYDAAEDAANRTYQAAMLANAEKEKAVGENPEPAGLNYTILYDPQPTLPGRLPDELPFKLYYGMALVGAFINKDDAEQFRNLPRPALGTPKKEQVPEQDLIHSEGFPEGWFVEDRPGENASLLCGPDSFFGAVTICLRPTGFRLKEWLATAKIMAQTLSEQEN